MELPDMDKLDDLLRLVAYYESCEVQGHLPAHKWDSTGTNDLNPPPGCQITCMRCGTVLEERCA